MHFKPEQCTLNKLKLVPANENDRRYMSALHVHMVLRKRKYINFEVCKIPIHAYKAEVRCPAHSESVGVEAIVQV
jgi:hypothetical protein